MSVSGGGGIFHHETGKYLKPCLHHSRALPRCRHSILDTLASGQHIVCDRYAFSGIAYSAAKVGLVTRAKVVEDG